jgi:hypothetical protein
MSEFEIPFKLENSQYNEVLMIEKYGDNYGIVLAQESKEGGTNYKRWVFPQRRVDGKNIPAEKAIPLRIPLGPHNQAVTLLSGMLAALSKNNNNMPPARETKPAEQDDIPF